MLGSAHADPAIEILAGGTADDSEGFFIRPTVLVSTDPTHDIFRTEYFGPILGVHVYEDSDWEAELTQLESVSPYALTGAVFARDRAAIQQASSALRFASGNFYVNDKPTGAVVGQQPFGGARASGTNDKAGSPLNLLRWTSPRAIKGDVRVRDGSSLSPHGLIATAASALLRARARGPARPAGRRS